jgi:hypothetical protein
MKNKYRIDWRYWKTRKSYAWTLYRVDKVCMPLGFETLKAAHDYIPTWEKLEQEGLAPYYSSGE